MNYEFDYGKGYVYSLLDTVPFSFDIDVKKTGTYEVWARVLGSQKLTLLINDFNKTVESSPLDPNGFTWVKLGELMLNEGKHEQQVVYSTFHDALTQICYGCKKIRSNHNFEEKT